jgi:hypothetical protein
MVVNLPQKTRQRHRTAAFSVLSVVCRPGAPSLWVVGSGPPTGLGRCQLDGGAY